MRELSDFVKDARHRYPLGLRVRGIVTDHEPFGFFLDIGDPKAAGLVQIVDILDDNGCLTLGDFPAVGASVEAVVIGWKDDCWKDYPCEIALSVKPSKLRGQEFEKFPHS